MLREKLTKELGFEKWRDVVKEKVPPNRIFTVLCAVLEAELAAICLQNEAAAKSTIRATDSPKFDPE